MSEMISDTPAFRPLYAQVRDMLVKRLISGSWTPGMMLPSEFQIARELGVSQGTVRKALDAMTAEHLLIRRQGRGTFVALPEEGRILFKFFRLVADEGERLFPQSAVIARGRAAAEKNLVRKLRLADNADVWWIDRVRRLGEKPVIFERITLPVSRFPGLGEMTEIPNNVYALYSERFGITIGKAEEKLKAASADAETAEHLRCPEGHPVLTIERVAMALDDTPIEHRVSTCLTDEFHYRADL
ncbi:transcription regulator protein [Fulvimarina pelagi HTCC2506]|uniref:Transcription regulator protein n=1 Tax=Fulvimarina pelagi HTCC2506 TaxID=314231 RepID=Q0G463_9HYPH|nr:GntR family transcriptional regulator [Fulvimarina pelagi]EAU41618.1 transcription regulator protein [Fulvimarina pelagi HTCC2506]